MGMFGNKKDEEKKEEGLQLPSENGQGKEEVEAMRIEVSFKVNNEKLLRSLLNMVIDVASDYSADAIENFSIKKWNE